MKELPYESALQHLRKTDPILFPHAHAHVGTLRARRTHRRRYADLFAALAGSIVSQQLSVKAADTIWERLKTACKGAVTADAVLALRVPAMRRAGLSAAKTKALKELAGAVRDGRVDFKKLKTLPEEEAIASLSQVWGIGRWTAEMFLLFALGREDIFSIGDLGLLRAMEELYGLPKDGPKEHYLAIAERWSPHRSFACLVLWRTRDAAP